jgi:hypothetical protein
MMTTIHAGFERLIATSLDFSLQPEDQAALNEHLSTCSACATVAAGYRADASWLRSIAFADPPPSVRAAVLGASMRPNAWRTDPWKLLLAAAVMLAAVVGATVAAGAIARLVAGHPDPIDWSSVPAGPALVSDTGSMRLEAVASHGDRFVAIGTGGGEGIIVTSSDGQTWSRVSDPPQFISEDRAHVFGDEVGFAILGGSPGNATIWTSSDGITWLANPIKGAAAVRGTAIGGGHAVLVGSRTVTDDIKGSYPTAAAWWRDERGVWQPATISGTAQPVELTAVVWTDDRFLAIGGPDVLSSPDGAVWRHVSATLAIGVTALNAGGDRMIASGTAGDAPAVWTSTDGVAWARAAIPAGTTGRILAVVNRAGLFVAVGSGPAGVASWYSTDGDSWTAARAIEGGAGGLMTDVAWGRDRVVAVGAVGSRAAIWTGREPQP